MVCVFCLQVTSGMEIIDQVAFACVYLPDAKVSQKHCFTWSATLFCDLWQNFNFEVM